MSADLYLNFDFIFETGKKIFEVLSRNKSNEEWINKAKQEYDVNCSYPDDTYSKISCALEGDSDLLRDFQGIVNSNDDIEQFYNSIFFPQDDDENYATNLEEEDETDGTGLFEEEEPSPEVVSTALTPELLEERQQKQVDLVSNTLFISRDLSYLLLKKFNWNSDRLTTQWLEEESKKELLKSLHVSESMIREPLTFTCIGKGECEICCLDDVDLYQMYCGHIQCFDCWKEEIEVQLSQGAHSIVCRVDDCYSEIMLSDVARFCCVEKAKSYNKFLLEDQISRDNKLIHCTAPGCQQVLTIDSVGLCGVATCSCGKRICWRCQNDAHAPLTCDQVDEWKKLRDEMFRISRAQTRWEKREFRLMDYRRSHLSEVQKANKEFNDQLKAEHEFMNKKELDEIKALKAELTKIKDKKLRLIKESKIKEKINENKMKQQDRSREREQIKNEQNDFINAIQSPANAKFYMHQLRESQELRAMEKYCTTDEEFIERMTKKCPKCKTPIQKNGGCNYMKCIRCGYEFCWVCGADWKTHGDHFSCNKFDGKNDSNDADDNDDLDDDDQKIDDKDKKYYLPPMNSEQRARFARWNHYYRRYQAHLDAQRLEKKNRDQYRDTLVKSWEYAMSNTTANELVDKVYRAIDVARSVLIYSYPTAYFMDMHSRDFFMFEMCQSNLEITNEKLVGMVERYAGQKPEDFEKFSDLNDKYIDATLREVDKYSY